jgi:hypothetical protein
MRTSAEVKPAIIPIDDACIKLRVSRSTLYSLARSGQIEIKKLSPKISRVVVESLERYIAGLGNALRGSPIKWSEEAVERKVAKKEQQNAERDAELAKLGL